MSLLKIMGQLEYIEQTGHGVPLIVSKYGKEAFTFLENHIIVTIPFAFVPSFEQLETNLSNSHKKILTLLNENPNLKIDQLCQLSELGRTRVTRILKDLKEQNKIERIGNSKSGYWKVNK